MPMALLLAGTAGMSPAAGLVEPTGSGKTGIIHLIPHAALGCQAPEDVPRKVLIVAPTIGQCGAKGDLYIYANFLTWLTCTSQ